MPEPADLLRQVDALAQLALRLAGSASSGRAALAKLADSLHPAWIPEPWDTTVWPALERARSTAREPVAFRQVEDILKHAWGGKPSRELEELDPKPVAVTATSQVHRGRREGESVAVKVLRPGIAAAARQDLSLLDALALPLGALLPAIDAQALLREGRERVLDEFDLEHEASTQRRFARALRHHPAIVVPTPVTELCRETVLVSSWIDGKPLSQGAVADPDRVASLLLSFVLGGLREGLVHADLDAADILELVDGRIAVLDYGAVATPKPERVEETLAVVRAFRAGDAEALGRSLGSLGMLTDPALGGEALSFAREALGAFGEDAPVRLDVDAVVAVSDRAARRPDRAIRLLLAGSLEPTDLWPSRAVAQLFSVIARMGATAAWPELVERALAEGWQAAR